MKTILITILSALLLQSCANMSPQPPKPATSEYFITLGGGFTMKINKAKELFYGINVVSRNTLEPSNFMVISYQNPSAAKPYIEESLVSELESSAVVSNATTYILRSPFVQGVKPHTNYQITIKLYSDSSKTELLATHEQLVNSSYNRN